MKFKKMYFYSSILLCIIFLFSSFTYITNASSFDDESLYVWSNNSSSLDSISNSVGSEVTTQSTVTTSSQAVDLGLQSQSAILIEQNSGKVLYEKNMHEQLRPASVTKIMSLLLIFEALDSGKISSTDTVPCSEKAASMGGSQIWLDTRESLTVDEMLKAICVNSANDCTVAMAEFVAGSTDSFVGMMNDKAKELGMNDTCFKNCHGLDEDGHITSAYDISLMSKELLTKHPTITTYTTIWTDSLRDGKSSLSNTNKLIRNYQGATGLKTGSTGLALYNLSASATRDNLSLIAVIMKGPTGAIRFAEAEKLLDYGFANYSYKEFSKASDLVKCINVSKGVSNSVNAIFRTSAGALIHKGASSNVEQVLTLQDTLEAPITAGQKLGEVSYTLDRRNSCKN